MQILVLVTAQRFPQRHKPGDRAVLRACRVKVKKKSDGND